jgi:hypothetical protein
MAGGNPAGVEIASLVKTSFFTYFPKFDPYFQFTLRNSIWWDIQAWSSNEIKRQTETIQFWTPISVLDRISENRTSENGF